MLQGLTFLTPWAPNWIDFSTGARAALLFALEDAARRGVPVEAVTAYRPPDYWMDFYAVGTYEPDQVRGIAVDRLRQFVTEVMAEASQPPPVVHLHVAVGRDRSGNPCYVPACGPVACNRSSRC